MVFNGTRFYVRNGIFLENVVSMESTVANEEEGRGDRNEH
jgi:hypothetical protein